MTQREVDKRMDGLWEMQQGRASSSSDSKAEKPPGLPHAQRGPSAAAPPAEMQPRALQQAVEDITKLKEKNEELERRVQLLDDVHEQAVEDIAACNEKNEELERRVLLLEQMVEELTNSIPRQV